MNTNTTSMMDSGYSYCTYNTIEIRLEDMIGHDTAATYSCKATDTAEFLRIAKSILKPNTSMHLRVEFGVEYDAHPFHKQKTEQPPYWRAVGIDNRNCCLILSFDVEDDEAVNHRRLEAFAKLAAEMIALVHITQENP